MKLEDLVSKQDLCEALQQYQMQRIEKSYPELELSSKKYKPNEKTEQKMQQLIAANKKALFFIKDRFNKNR